MKIQEVELLTANPEAQRRFYRDVLKLPASVVAGDKSSVLVRAGASYITFSQAPSGWDGFYHFAFNISQNLFAQAVEWAKDRVALIGDSTGQTEFFFESWNAHSIYFYDPAGNILEFIARHSLRSRAAGPFSARNILSVSEIGIAVEDVAHTIEHLQASYNLPVYGGPASDQFTALGDKKGLLILVRVGRTWFPDTGKAAGPYPVVLRIATPAGTEARIAFDGPLATPPASE